MRAPSVNRRVAIAALAAVAAPGRVIGQGRSRLVLLTGGAGGVFSEYGLALARLLGEKAGLDVEARQTGGSNDNIRALDRGEADLGLVNMGPAYDAWEGRPPFEKDGPQRRLRALFAMYETPFSLVTLRSKGVTKLSDLKGRTVGVGPAGGPGEVFFKGLTRELGIDTKLATGSPNELAARVLGGEVDAFWFGAGVPVGAFVQVLEKGDGLVFALEGQEVAALRKAFPYFAPYEIPAGAYKGQTESLKTAAVWNFVLASERLSEDAAYAVTKAALDDVAAIRAAVPAATGTAAANATTNGLLTFHPGAARYYREAGIALPRNLLPG